MTPNGDGTSSAASELMAADHTPAEHVPATVSPREAIAERVATLLPGSVLERVVPFGVDTSEDDASTKGMGYGKPLRVEARDRQGARHSFVFHTATPNEYGHDRRADRAAEMVLAYDTFAEVPRHTRALDVGAVADDGRLVSLSGTGEFYLLTSYAPGRPYAEDLRRIMERGEVSAEDLRRAAVLGRYLASLHTPVDEPQGYVRAIRDLVGHGEGIFGIVDGYPVEAGSELEAQLARIEAGAVRWRSTLKQRTGRVTRTHGDFHPFNLLFDEAGELSLLDASRGCLGDPADDVVALSINYLFFGLQCDAPWDQAFGRLWQRFFESYREGRSDAALGEVMAPFFAWRALVLASPRWYPAIAGEVRTALLDAAETLLGRPRFNPAEVAELLP